MGLGQIIDVFKCCLFTWGTLTTILPAFLLAGALIAFIPSTSVARHLGSGAKKPVAYGIGSSSGVLLPVCSCNVVPLFISIHQSGAGLGPAIAFLYGGPAINPVSLVMTLQIVGWRPGIWRAAAVPLMAIAVGLMMSLLYRREEKVRQAVGTSAANSGEKVRNPRELWLLFGVLVIILFVGGTALAVWIRVAVAATLLAALAILVIIRFSRDDFLDWMEETLRLVKTVIPLLVVCVVLIGFLSKAVPIRVLLALFGENDVKSVLFASTFGSLMYFPLLSEIVFAKSFLKRGMAAGPALAILLTGPGLSLPGLLLIRKVLGVRKTLVYMVLLVATATAVGMLFGYIYGEYLPCCTFLPGHRIV